METVIRVKKDELDGALLEKLKSFVEGIKHPVITIKISDNDEGRYIEALENSVDEAKRGEIVSFSMEEFTEYIKSVR